MTSTAPVARFRVSGFALFAKSAATRAKTRVNTTHSAMTVKFGISPKEKWETAPVRAVNVIIKTLVPTAVLSSY